MLVNEKREIHNPILVVLLIGLFIGSCLKICTDIPRIDFPQLITWYTLAFVSYLLLALKTSTKYLKWLLVSAILIRLALIFGVPSLSDDYFRFLWDGHLFANGINPFEYKPSEYIKLANDSTYLSTLYPSLNSKDYFSVYPAFLQYLFGMASKLFPFNAYLQIVFLKTIVVGAEIGSLFLISKIIKHLKLPVKSILLYAMNPLIIIELSSNLHFEVLMIFFVLLAIFFLGKQRISVSAIALSLAFASKLLPVLFLPFIIKQIGLKKGIQYFFVFAGTSILLFVPFYFQDFFFNFFTSIKLYVEHFEFNAGVFYAIRTISPIWNDQIVFWFGRILSLSFISIILYRFIKKRNLSIDSLFNDFMWILLVYLLLSKVVHPWYITPIIAFSIFTRYRFAILWSYLIFATYIAYQSVQYQENLWVVLIEYFVLGMFIYFEIKLNKRSQFSNEYG